MKILLRIVAAVIVSPLWIPLVLAGSLGCGILYVFMCIPALLNFAVTGEWLWPHELLA
jgi:hypothetical protein